MPVPPKCAAPAQLSLNQNGTLLAGAGQLSPDATTTDACVWTVAARHLAADITKFGKVYSVSFAADDATALLIMSNDSIPVSLIDTNNPDSTKNSMASTVNWPKQPEAVAFAPGGATLAVSDRQTNVVQTFYISGAPGIKDQLNGITRGDGGGYGSLAYSPNGQRLVRGEPAGFVVFTTAGAKVATGAPATPGGAMPAAFAGNDHVVTCHGDQLEYWDIKVPQAPKYTARLSGGTCVALAVSADGKKFAVTMTAGANAAVNVGNLPTSWK
jgi:hypothetical protein